MKWEQHPISKWWLLVDTAGHTRAVVHQASLGWECLLYPDDRETHVIVTQSEATAKRFCWKCFTDLPKGAKP